MQEIEKLRAEIDQIHEELTALFRRRLALTKKIWEIKKAKSLPLFDPKREEEIFHQFDHMISESDEKKAVHSFYKFILRETKVYLEAKFNMKAK